MKSFLISRLVWICIFSPVVFYACSGGIPRGQVSDQPAMAAACPVVETSAHLKGEDRANKCSALTKAGNPCKRAAKSTDGYCWQHAK